MTVTYQFKNIGPIKEAELELGDLTIIAGANNTGKTYLTYALYGFLRSMEPYVSQIGNSIGSFTFIPDVDSFWDKPAYEATDELIVAEVTDRSVTCDINLDFLASLIRSKMAYHSEMFSDHGISEFFSARQERFQNARILCDVSSISQNLDKLNFFSIITKWSLTDGDQLKITMKDIFDRDVIHYAEYSFMDEGEERHFFYKHIIANMFAKILLPVSPFILSSERFGISLFYKELDFTKNRLVEHLQSLRDKNKPDEEFDFLDRHSSRYAKPIKDNIDFTRDMENIQKKRGGLFNDKLSDGIKQMMGGYYRHTENEIRFISQSRTKEKAFKLPLHLASSSARGFSDLYFYLQHVAEKGQLLIIDEPESHLDTTNQIELARLLARLVHAGVKVLVTTHSDYLIKELNNLIMLSADFDGKDDFLKKYKKHYSKDDYIEKERVRGYICESGTLTKCKVDSRGVLMPNFDDTIEQINRLSNTLHLMLGDQ